MFNTKQKKENGVLLQAFEWELPANGTHWAKLSRMGHKLSRMGFSAVWLPPAAKGAGGKKDVGYGVYDLYDLGEFDQKGSVPTKYGTAEEFYYCVRSLRNAGLMVLSDMVLNHRIGADVTERVEISRADPGNRNRVSDAAETVDAYTKFAFPGRGKKYSSFVWDHTRFTGFDRTASGEAGLFLLKGKSWARDVDGENGNYDYLMGLDVDVRDPYVERELIRYGLWFLRKSGADGFRLDAVKHISASFMRDWLSSLREETGRELFSVGEYWQYDVNALLRYLDATGRCMSLFDVPLHGHFREASRSGGAYDMRRLFSGTLTEAEPALSVTFVDNHDTQPGQSLESWVDGWFKAAAYGFLLLGRAGFPCVFWGDLYGIPKNGIGAVPALPALLRLRRESAFGEEHRYLDHERVVGLTREGSEEVPGSGLAFLCTDAAGGEKRMYVGRQFAGSCFRCDIGEQEPVIIDEEGFGVFRVDDGGISVYTPEPDWKIRLLRLLWSL